MTRVVPDSSRPWLPLDGSGENFIKIVSVDEVRKQVIMIVKFAPNSVYPKHLHHAGAIAYTIEGEWEYEEGILDKGAWAIEPPGTDHTPLISDQGATILAVLTSDTDVFVEVFLDDGTVIVQDIDYFKKMYAMTPEEAARAVSMQVPMSKR
jgi:quercetin dioxygenase-like cupin family protein